MTAGVSTPATPEQLDAAILAELAKANGQLLAWSTLRDRLPSASFWAKAEALVRLHDARKLHAFMIDGRTYVDTAITLRLAA
ncbi:hypothetical protein BST27_29685 [Mycobacterium intermedium]|uniref:Uncharacterized protein n=1 Tax=Mycobacterium intermedium TaxID=28445 RepID=A0A1E3SE41_MYCIE|nr:hypothetical protein [Mycobacterium intermedium]MCV6965982.1 hypothetical protein [Mycobacterium intermedium]ODR00342.1 hypothetical protein BHQ20_13365 [Mycobacterium intermedium]OPE51048.1 hypothetical protein BV508_07730 [Mycobacterium intermedium]ORA90511.1 hypothetical protein BST27_29685 [Mycobacterium intermedium]